MGATHAQARGEPSRVAVLYERAVAVFPVTHVLWAQYGRYLEAHLRMPGVASAVYSRAVRNCPWVGALWARQENLTPTPSSLICGRPGLHMPQGAVHEKPHRQLAGLLACWRLLLCPCILLAGAVALTRRR